MRHFIVGFCIEEQALAELSGAAEETKATPPERFPLTAQAFPAVLATTADERFELGIRLLLSGLA